MITADPIQTAELQAVEALKELRNYAAALGMPLTAGELSMIADKVKCLAAIVQDRQLATH